MKRSEINKAILYAINVLDRYLIKVPFYGYLSLDKILEKKNDLNNVKKLMLGWDVTDYGEGKFDEFGATLFTLRNGLVNDLNVGTPYAEKLIILKDSQALPLHYHASKTEDIINRAGGVLAIELFNKNDDGTVDQFNDVEVYMDGIKKIFHAGERILIMTGNSITLKPFIYHRFYSLSGTGDLVIGEVSSINDDFTDNYNALPISRFTKIEEDEPIVHPLCNELSSILDSI
jgi:D-lyxose ketol-isomerase